MEHEPWPKIIIHVLNKRNDSPRYRPFEEPHSLGHTTPRSNAKTRHRNKVKSQSKFPAKETHLLQFGLHPSGLEAEELRAGLLGGIPPAGSAGHAAQSAPGQHGE